MKFEEVRYRNCGYCRVVGIAMSVQWSSRYLKDAAQEYHAAAALGCPRCGRVTLVELVVDGHPNVAGTEIHDRADVYELSVLPEGDLGIVVRHLPAQIAGFFETAQRALEAGLPDAAAVQLRKTLEASAVEKGVKEPNLYTAVKKLLDQNYITQDFAGLLDHIRKIGNLGAHYNDVQLTTAEVERSLRFTTQVLRNLFEVPGELRELEQETAAAAEASEAQPEPRALPI